MKFIVVDTETTNSIDDPLTYDIGFAVVDETGKVYEKYSYVVADIFLDKELMESAYFAEKIPQYWEEIKKGERELKGFFNIRRKFKEVVNRNHVAIVLAHNARFDYRALNLTSRFLTGSKVKYFLPYGTVIADTLKMSREVLKDNETYEEFCYNNNYLTKRMCKKFTAEVIYRFLSGNNDFEEEHTGLADVLIEKDIFAYCYKQNPTTLKSMWE
ncbi:MAG: hypothetical protein IKN65_06195 [Clostridia bacterium]|nr:hypothetical protein [Clostridia bacterium]